MYYFIWCSALGVVAVVLRNRCLVLCTVCEFVSDWLCVNSPCYPAWNAHAPYCHLWPSPLYNIFPLFLINGTIFERKKKSYWTQNVCFDFLYNFSEIFLILGINERDVVKKCILVFIYSNFYSCPTSMKLEFSKRIFEKSSNVKFRENTSIGSRVVPCGPIDGQIWRS